MRDVLDLGIPSQLSNSSPLTYHLTHRQTRNPSTLEEDTTDVRRMVVRPRSQRNSRLPSLGLMVCGLSTNEALRSLLGWVACCCCALGAFCTRRKEASLLGTTAKLANTTLRTNLYKLT